MMIFQLSLLATLSVVIFLPSQCASQATLTQKSAEVKLDGSESMELVCSVNGSISNTRVWTGGPGFQPIITNGVSSDSSKYTETIQTADFSLHVHNVIVDDVCGVRFKCSNGFANSEPVTIVLNSSIFIYVPIASEIQFKEEYDDTMKMTVFVNLTTVFPEPTCTAERGTTVITSQLQSNSYNNGNCGLKTTELRITNETYDCSGQVVITCNVGSQSIVVFTGNSPCKSDESSNDKTRKIVGGVLGGVGGAVVAAGLVVGGSKLVKKQASVKNSEEDKSKKNSKEDKSKKNSKKRKSKNEKDKTNADNAEGGRSSAAADSTGVKAVGNMERENLKIGNMERENLKIGNMERENLKNQNSAEENQKVEYVNEERLENTHSDKDTRKETNDAAAVADDQITLISGNTS